MATSLPDSALDAILALQLSIAWAGEGRCSPARLGWWETDLVDTEGGGDFFSRLLPQTHAWAALEAVREAARRVDEQGRGRRADPDRMRTLFFLGFAVDEQLADRLAALKRKGGDPAAVLPLPLPLGVRFSPEAFAAALQHPEGAVPFEVVPGGRQVRGAVPVAPEAMVRRLAAALVPLADRYPLPFFPVESPG